MIIINAMDIVAIVLLGIGLALVAVAFVVDKIACWVKKGQQKRIDEAFKEEEQ